MFLVAAQQAQRVESNKQTGNKQRREHEKIYHIHSTVIKSN